MGGGVKYYLRNKNNIYSPSFTALILTDIGSNYRGGYLLGSKYNHYYPNVRLVPVTSYTSPYINGYPKSYVKEAYYYVSTPLVINLYFGNEFKIYKTLRVNLGIGYLARAVKVRYKTWNGIDPEPSTNLSNKYSLKEVVWFHKINLSLGLNYTFSFKKKPKTTTP